VRFFRKNNIDLFEASAALPVESTGALAQRQQAAARRHRRRRTDPIATGCASALPGMKIGDGMLTSHEALYDQLPESVATIDAGAVDRVRLFHRPSRR
jgi:hypothetical protein